MFGSICSSSTWLGKLQEGWIWLCADVLNCKREDVDGRVEGEVFVIDEGVSQKGIKMEMGDGKKMVS